jgi:hypothetical protein
MIRLRTMIVGTALAIAAASPSMAQNAQERAALQQNCAGDYMRLCSMYDPGSKDVEQCFKAKSRELSPECRGAIAAFSRNNPAGRR